MSITRVTWIKIYAGGQTQKRVIKMNVIEKQKHQSVINGLISGEESAIKSAVVIKDAFRAKMQELTMQGSATYSQEYLEKEMQKTKNDLAAKMQTAYSDTEKRLEQIRTLIHERDAVLDLSNPALSNALSLITTIGSNLSFQDTVKIQANFLHDQSALRALRSSYQAHEIATGWIDQLIYDIDSTIDNLKNLAYQAFFQDASINIFANAFAKFANLEGMTVEKLPDANGAMESMRAAAGL